jgi:Uma2 family endonuclease
MEQLLSSIATLKWKMSSWKHFFYQAPNIVFEIANPSNSEEIFFYISVLYN